MPKIIVVCPDRRGAFPGFWFGGRLYQVGESEVDLSDGEIAALEGEISRHESILQVKRIAAKGSGSLSITFFSSLLLSIWSANAAMKAMFDALNVVYEEEEKRNFFWLNLRSLTFTVGALLFIIVALNVIVVVPVVLNFLGLGSTAWLLAALRWPAILIEIGRAHV